MKKSLQEIQISITPVIHRQPPEKSTEFYDHELFKASYSQFGVAETIFKKSEKAIVLVDNLYENLTPQTFAILKESKSATAFCEIIKAFPDNISESTFKLNKFQKSLENSNKQHIKELLLLNLTQEQRYSFGQTHATSILFCLGQLSHVYKTLNEDEVKSLRKNNNPDEKNIFKMQAAIKWAKIAAQESGKTEILFICSQDYNFSLCSDPSVTFKESINTLPVSEFLPIGFFAEDDDPHYLTPPTFPSSRLPQLAQKGIGIFAQTSHTEKIANKDQSSQYSFS